MPRTLDPTLKAALESGAFNAYIQAKIGVNYVDVLKYKLTGTTLDLEISNYIGGTTVILERGVIIEGTTYKLSTSKFYIIEQTLDQYANDSFNVKIQAHIIPKRYFTIAGDDTYRNIITAFCDEFDKIAVFDQPTADLWDFQFLPTGKNYTTNDAQTFLNFLAQKYFIYACDNGNEEILFFQGMADRTGDSQYNVWQETPNPIDLGVNDIITKTPFRTLITDSTQRTYIARDESGSIRNGGTPNKQVHNLGFLKSTDEFPERSEELTNGTTETLPFLINLFPQDGDIIVFDPNEVGIDAYPIEVIEEYNTSKNPAWSTTIKTKKIFTNTSGGSLPSTIERVAAYTPLVSSGFDGNLTPDVNNLQALAEAVDDLVLGGASQEEVEDYVGAMFTGNTETGISVTYDDASSKINLVADVVETDIREKLTANRTYYVRYDIGAVTLTIASPCVVTKASHGLSNNSPVVFSILPNMTTITVTIASPGVVTWIAHGLTANQPIKFRTTGALPTGITAGTTYYVVGASITANTFQISATPGGAAINTSGTQSGTHYSEMTGALPTGLSVGTVYYARNVTTNTFEVSASVGGASINTSGTQSGIFNVATGSDSNDGLTNSITGAFLTIPTAENTASALDINGYTVTIQLANSFYVESSGVTLNPILGDGFIVIQGNSTYPDNVHVNNPTGSTGLGVFNALVSLNHTVKDLKISCSGGMGFRAVSSYLKYSNIDFGTCSVLSHCLAIDTATLEQIGNVRITGNSPTHISARQSMFKANLAGYTYTLLDKPSFSTSFAEAVRTGFIVTHASPTFSGTATGKRYTVSGNSYILPGSASASETFFPGDTLGTRNSGGEYGATQNYPTRVSSQFDKTNTTLESITGLSATLLAGRTYSGRLVLYTTSNVGGGVKIDFNGGTATATSFIAESLVIQTGAVVATTASRSTALNTTIANVTAVTVATILVEFTITVNGAGTFIPEFACNVAVGTSSVLVGSTLVLSDITP